MNEQRMKAPVKAKQPWNRAFFPALIVTLGMIAWFAQGRLVFAQPLASAPVWKTAAELPQALQSRLSLQWSENPLRPALANLANSQRTAIWLDRRLDPGQRIELSADEQPLEVILQRLCLKLSAGQCRIGPVIYLAPPESANCLATLAAIKRQEAANLPALKAAFAKVARFAWPEFAEPRQLAEKLAAEAGLTISNPLVLPHDLWPSGDFPPLSLADRLTLVAAGFDLTYTIADGSLTWVPQPAAVVYEQGYPWKGNIASAIAQVREKVPAIVARAEGNQIIARGRFEDHELLARLLSGQSVKTTKVVEGEKVYTLKVDEQQAGAVVKLLAQRLERQLKYEPAVLEKLQQRVSFDVDKVTLEELLRKTLDPLELTYRLDATALEILPKPLPK